MNPDVREETPASPAPWTWRTTVLALAWSAGVFAVYLANGREIWSGDSVAAKYLTCEVVRGDGFEGFAVRRKSTVSGLSGLGRPG